MNRAHAITDIHFHQKWQAVWPVLATLPRTGVRLLDAGCGDGRWAVEIGRRRPGWHVFGIDRDRQGIEQARERQAQLGQANVSFGHTDFEHFTPESPFDVMLSVCSAHYQPSVSESAEMFRHMSTWLTEAGRLILLVPRTRAETPLVRRLGIMGWPAVFTRQGLIDLCQASGLRVQQIEPCIGRLGTLAKQIDWQRATRSAPVSYALWTVARTLAVVGTRVAPSARSLMWLVIAHRSSTL